MKNIASRVVKLQTLAVQVFVKSGLGDKACAELRKQIMHDPELLSQAVDVAVVACLRAAPLCSRSQAESGDRHFLFGDWLLRDGETRLAKATREQLLNDAERYEAMATGNRRSSCFLRLIADRLERDQPVHEVLAEPDLIRFWDQSKGF